MTNAQRASLLGLSVLMVFAGVMHFVRPAPFIDIVPDYLPAPRTLVYLSGIAEILGGLGILLPATRRLAAYGLVALFVCVFPANVHMAVHDITPTGAPDLPDWLPWARLPLQLLFIYWALVVARMTPDNRSPRTAQTAGPPQ